MAIRGDGLIRSEKRQRVKRVHVRLTIDEWLLLQAKVDDFNSKLPRAVSQRAKMTLQRVLVTAACRREFIPIASPPILDTAVASELATIRRDMARLGTMLKTWLEYGRGEHRGKGPASLKINVLPNGMEATTAKDILYALKDVTKTVASILENAANDS